MQIGMPKIFKSETFSDSGNRSNPFVRNSVFINNSA